MCGQVGRFKPRWAGHMLRLKGSHHPEQRGIFFLLLFHGNTPNVCVCATKTVLLHVSLNVSLDNPVTISQKASNGSTQGRLCCLKFSTEPRSGYLFIILLRI